MIDHGEIFSKLLEKTIAYLKLYIRKPLTQFAI